jgi:hypothetical protein
VQESLSALAVGMKDRLASQQRGGGIMSLYHVSSRSWVTGLLLAASASLLLLGPSVVLGAADRGRARQPFPSGISLNEFMPLPASDWNDDGATNQGDEYIELYNANPFDADISGWMIDDVADSGSSPYVLPPGTVLRAQRHLLLFAAETGIDLADEEEGDELRLMTPDGVLVESYDYVEATADGAYSKTSDGGGAWTSGYSPSPGASNLPPAPPTATPTSTAIFTPPATPTPTATPTPVAPMVSLNEFMPNPAADWNGDGILGDENDEYIELYNANAFALDLSGWRVDDAAGGGSAPYTLPAGTMLPAGGFLALWSRDTGIALNNSGGDSVRLLRPDGVEMESHPYTAAPVDGAHSKTVDGGNQWTQGYPPSPGASNQPAPTPTPTPTSLPYPTGISLNEFMPNPAADWNDDGTLSDENDEYIELYNANAFDVDISGWKLDDVAGGGTAPYTLPAGTVLRAQRYLVLFSVETGIGLNNSGGDWVRLLTPDGVEVESHAYTSAPADGAHSKTVDGGNDWTQTYPPSPGASNQPPVWTATPTATATRTPSSTPTTTPTATATVSPAPYPTGISLNEFMPNPAADWNGDGILGDENDEYIELYNANAFDVDISGWRVDDVAGDGSAPYTLPAGITLPAGGFLALWSRDTRLALNNSGGDSVRLLTPDGVEVESHAYTAAPADGAYSKTVDGGSQWTPDYPPSPGATNQAAPTPTPTPTATPGVYPDGISLNEYMPDPTSDWNGDGAANQDDEYIELYNANDIALDLSGWRLDDMDDGFLQPRFLFGPDGSPPYTLPAGTIAPARGFLLFFRSQTGIALNNDGDWVRLLRPDGVVVEAVEYPSSRNDEAYSKTSDGGSEWTRSYPPSPGASNQPAPTTPTPSPTPTATPGAPPTPYPDGVSLNEFMPNPAADWNDDGILGDENDEYIELYNANLFDIDISGWRVDDVAGGGSAPYTLPAGTTLPAGGFLALWSRDTGIALNNSGGDSVRLLRPDGVEVESHVYTAAPADGAYSKTVDGGNDWTQTYPPSPGATNQAAPTPTPTPTATPGVYPDGISLNEYMPDPASDWNGDGAANQDDEYIELYNANDFAVDLSGWRLDDMDDDAWQPRFLFGPDGSPPYTLPAGTIAPARGFLLFFRSQTGVALNNDGDWVRLLRPDGVVVEAVEYPSSRNDEAYSKTSDGGNDWTRSYPPSPGATNQAATPTPTPTVTPTVTPGSYPDGVSLNEFMPNPAADWNGDGILGDENDEYIELYNAAASALDLSGWQVDDVAGGGSTPYTLPAGTTLPAGGFLALWSRDTHLALNNSGGDSVRLLRPDGVEVESYAYTSAPADGAYSKTVDGGDQWTQGYPPSPDATNQAATPTPTPTVTPTATPGVYPVGISLNEYMPDPASDWDGSGIADENDEYIELYNANDFAVDLSGWRLDDMDDGLRAGPDGSPPYSLPAGTTVPARGFLLFFRSQTGIALNNDGDWVRLLRPDGAVVEEVEYSSTRDDQAASKTVDGGDAWTRSYPPTPGGSNTPGGTPTPTPTATPLLTPTPVATTVRLNEVLPSPRDVDWDGNGAASYLDEWIELANLGDEPVEVGGWKLVDGPPAGHEPAGVYVLPAGAVVPARGHLLIFRAQSSLALNANDEWLRLLYPDGSEADTLHYDQFSGYDQSWCRLPDGAGGWSRFCIESPGQANQADPNSGGSSSGSSGSAGGGGGQPYDRFNYDLLPIAQARSLPDRTRLTLEGQVTVLPNLFDEQNIYIQDATGGMLVYLRSGEWPPLSEGQWVRVNGRLDTFYGEREISLVRIDDIKTMQPAAPPLPLPIRSGEMDEAHEGRLVQLSGPITGYWKETTLYLDDGSGEARVTLRPMTGIRRPYVVIGEAWTVVGVVSQSESGYRLLPRREADLQRGRAAVGRAAATTRSNSVQDDRAWNRAPIYLPITGMTLLVRPPTPANLWEAWLLIR